MPRKSRAQLSREIAEALTKAPASRRSGRSHSTKRQNAEEDRRIATATRNALLKQEIARVASKVDYHQGRVDRGTADVEDRAALRLYERIANALSGMTLLE